MKINCILLLFFILGIAITTVSGSNSSKKRLSKTNQVDSLLDVLNANVKVRHTPIPTQVADVKRSTFLLNGNWFFNPSPEKEFEKKTEVEEKNGWVSMYVPSEWHMDSFVVKKGSWAGYFRTVSIPKDWNGKRVVVRFGAVNSECRLYVNGNFVGSHVGAMNQFEFEITSFINPDSNRVALYVRSESIADEIGRISSYAHHQVGGILRQVSLFALPQNHVSDLFYNASLSSDLQKGNLNVDLNIDASRKLSLEDMAVEVIVRKRGIEGLSHSNEAVVKRQFKLRNSKVQYQIDIPIDHPDLWHAESPYLYTTELNLFEKGKKIESISKYVGFRKIEIRGNVLMVNNKPIKLRGVASHDITPYEGRAIKDTAEIRRDVEIYRNANCNYLRAAHYPKDDYFLELCDRYGIFVENEVPICWLWSLNGKSATEVRKIKEHILYSLKSLLIRDQDHPSVLVWSLANESKWSPDFLLCYKLCKKLSPSIPVKFSHSDYFGIDNPLDVGSRHYPGWEGLVKYSNYFRPIIFDEAMHVNTYNTSENTTDPGVRDVWGDYLKYFVDNMNDAPAIAGLGIWSGIDEMFYPHNQKPIGYGPWGVIDGFRREKPEYWHMKMSYSPIQVCGKTFQAIDDKTLIIVENRYNVNDLNHVNILWKDGNASGSISASGEAGKQHSLIIPHKMQGDKLELTFEDKRGFVISQWSVDREVPSHLMPAMDFTKKTISSIGSDLLTVKSQQLTYQFSLKNGTLISVNKGTRSLIGGGIQMYLIPHSKSNEVIDFIPSNLNEKIDGFLSNPQLHWTCDSVSSSISDVKVQVTCYGKYDSIAVKYIYKMNGDGQMRIDYIVNIEKVKIQDVRQIGIGFNLEKSFNRLYWKREGLWSVYPEDHIGRAVGEAKAFYPETLANFYANRSTPSHSYSKDGNASGSNDFRSTKHNIYSASLQTPDGYSVSIESNGKQHFRSWVTDKGTSFLLANYSNGGNEHYLSYDSSRTKISPDEFKLDGGDFAGWLQIDFDND